MCFQERNLGQRLNIILVAEGAIDRDGGAITADRVKEVSVSLSFVLVAFHIIITLQLQEGHQTAHHFLQVFPRQNQIHQWWFQHVADTSKLLEVLFVCLFAFFCVPQLYLWGSPLLGEIFAYVTVF